jgi:hypothetical protein
MRAPVRQAAKFLSNQRKNRYRNPRIWAPELAINLQPGHPEKE